MSNNPTEFLAEEFLTELFWSCTKSDYVLAMVTAHLKAEQLPDSDFVFVFRQLHKHHRDVGRSPQPAAFLQMIAARRGAAALYDGRSAASDKEVDIDGLMRQLEEYIRRVELQRLYKDIGSLYNEGQIDKAQERVNRYVEWQASFGLLSAEFVSVTEGFGNRLYINRSRYNDAQRLRPVHRFYVDELDDANGGRNLRTQLTCIMAATGVGKSHAARWVGISACREDGLNVLHIQLEGSQEEVVNAYSAGLVGCSAYLYETGLIADKAVEEMEATIRTIKGLIHVKAYPKFNARVTTMDVKKAITEYKRKVNDQLDVVIIDSLDLLSPSHGRFSGENQERFRRVEVANQLKDMAAEEGVWMVTTYQSTIESRDWINDERNVLSEFNSSEAKGIARPMTHLITLNQSDAERKERRMRLHVAKSRFFPKGDTVSITTDYEHEQFYVRPNQGVADPSVATMREGADPSVATVQRDSQMEVSEDMPVVQKSKPPIATMQPTPQGKQPVAAVRKENKRVCDPPARETKQPVAAKIREIEQLLASGKPMSDGRRRYLNGQLQRLRLQEANTS